LEKVEEPGLGPLDRLAHFRGVAAYLDKGGNAERGHRSLEGMMSARRRSVDIEPLGPFRRAPGAVLVLVLEQESDAAANRVLHRFLLRRIDRLRLRRRVR